MLIKALCDYYDCTEKNSDHKMPNYLSEQNVHYMIMLSGSGEIEEILDIRVPKEIVSKNGKPKTVINPVAIRVPKRSQKTGIDINIIEHRPLYIFGLNYDNGSFTQDDKTDKAKKSHNCFINGNLKFCRDLNSQLAKAYCLFLEKWRPDEQCENPYLLRLGKEYATSYFCFGISGHPEIVLHEDPGLLDKYRHHFEENEGREANSETRQMCPIEGDNLPTARIHNKISGIKGGNSVGCVLVGVKENAFESFGKTQAFNSGISTMAMQKYTSTLNKLVADRKHRIFLDDMTLIFFGIAKNDKNECDFFQMLINGDENGELNSNLKTIASEMISGRVADLSSQKINENTVFYIAGITPNSSRISQKFVYRNKFGVIINNLIQHQKDITVNSDENQVSLNAIYKELISPKSSKETLPSPLASAIFQSMLNGTPYPNMLLSTVIRRIKTDGDDEKNRFIKINNTRIGIVKACLNRKARFSGKKEEVTMALDTQNKTPAYLCGRLFALLEYVQQKASGGALNKTIKDSFFASACSKPSVVFPRILKLSQNHLGKIDGGGYYNKLVGEIIALLENEFPQTLSLDEQGKFIIGYYHENKALYTPKNA